MIKTVSIVNFPRDLFPSLSCLVSVSARGDGTIKTLPVRFVVRKVFEEEERDR